jgi:hypothetical protein
MLINKALLWAPYFLPETSVILYQQYAWVLVFESPGFWLQVLLSAPVYLRLVKAVYFAAYFWFYWMVFYLY